MVLKKVEFVSGMALGDTLMLTAAIRDFKKAYPDRYAVKMTTHCMHIWDYNPYLSTFEKEDMRIELGPKAFVLGSQTRGLHYINGFRESITENLNLQIPQGPLKPDLHLSAEEKEDKLLCGPYWIICPGGKEDFGTKVWPPQYWQQVIDAFPDIMFVQVGENNKKKGIWSPKLRGDNLIDLVGTTEHPDTGLRDLFKLYYHCDGSLGHVSMQMHLAAAFDKACVIVAGAREPASFEQYNHHRYLHLQGSLRCKNDCENCSHYERKGKHHFCMDAQINRDYWKDAKLCPDYTPIDPAKLYLKACWKSVIEGCTNPVQQFGKTYPKCIMMITPENVIQALGSYYDGGALRPSKIKARVNERRAVAKPAVALPVPTSKKVFRMVANAHFYIGGEKSVTWILRAMERKGYHTQIVPTKHVCPTFRKNMGSAQVMNNIAAPCDILMVYCNDMSYDFHKDHYKILGKVNANRKVMMLNYKLGKAGQEEWTKHWDHYGFLSSQMKDEFLERVPGVSWFVLPPAVDIEPYLRENVSYNKTLHLVRHSSQGDNKYPDNFNEILSSMKQVAPTAKFSFMPGPTFLNGFHNVQKYTFDQVPVMDFLKQGSCYWYMLPPKYSDQGPRTIVEAMALGLPCIADNRWGAKDRITESTGWLCDDLDDYYDVIETLDHKVLKLKGEAAKARARDCFNPDRWVEEIIG
jgi:ADP-heptose:LPS heptosyltransferase